MNKPVVDFRGDALFYPTFDGQTYQAKVYAIDHPRLQSGIIFTSRLVSDPLPDQFETLNTIYKKETDENVGD